MLIGLQSKKCDMFLYIRQTDRLQIDTDRLFRQTTFHLLQKLNIANVTQNEIRLKTCCLFMSTIYMESSLWKFYDGHHDLVNRYGVSVSQMTQICSVCRNYNPILSSFMVYHRDCNKSSTTHATYGAWAAYPSRTHEFNPSFSGVRVARFLVFNVMLCRLLFVLFLLVIVLSVLLRLTTSD
jgi:hypothetical protein